MPETVKFPLRMPDTMQSKIVQLHKKDNCFSQNEFILKALDFYIGYLEGQDMPPFLCEALLDAIRGTYQISENRVSNNIFRLSVEMNMVMHLLATALDITEEEVYSLRGRSVREVKKTRGQIKVDDAIAFQQRESYD